MNVNTKVSVVVLSWLAMWAWLCVVPSSSTERGGSAAAADNDNTASDLKAHTDLSDPVEIESTKQVVNTPKPQPVPMKVTQDWDRATANKLKADYHKPESIVLEAELDRVNSEIDKLKNVPVPKAVPLPLVKAKASKVAVRPNAAQERAELTAAQTKLANAQQRYRLAQQQSIDMLIPEIETATAIDSRVDRQVDLDPEGDLVLAPILTDRAIATEKSAATQRSSRTKEIKAELANAQQELETAQAGLTAVIERHQHAQLAWQMAELDRQERSFTAELARVKQMESVNLQSHNRKYQLAQLQLKKLYLESQIKELAVAVTPFDSTVQQVKMVAKEGNMIRYEVGVSYAQATVQPRSEAIAFPRWQEDREEEP